MKRILAIVLVALLAGCTSPVHLAPADAVRVADRKKDGPARVPIVFAPLVDARAEHERASAGSVGGREVRGEKLTAWINRSLQLLGGQRFASAAAGTPGSWQVTPKLRQLYASSLHSSESANVVIELEIVPPVGEPVTKVYRGRITSMNWWNSSGEIEGSISEALRKCLVQVAADLDQIVADSSPN